MFAKRIGAACLLMGALGACTSSNEIQQRFAYRWGPDPGLPADNVQSTIAGQVQVLDYISWNAFHYHYPDVPPGVSPAAYWFAITEWGFNVGRQDCEIYMDYMFRLNREKARDDGIIAGLSAASSAIVSATAKSPASTLSVLAATFGLATALNDAVFQSYLFSEAPGLISIKVAQLQNAYQQQVEQTQAQAKTQSTPKIVTTTTKTSKTATTAAPGSAASTDQTTTVVVPIASPEQAYNAIQNYYHLCLPQSIEGVLLQAVADTNAKPSSPSTSSTPTLQGKSD